MFDWIADYVQRWAGVVEAHVLDALHWAVHAAVGVYNDVFTFVGAAWQKFYAAIGLVWRYANQYLIQAALWIIHLVTVTIPVLWVHMLAGVANAINWATTLYNRAVAFANALWLDVLQRIANVITWVTNTIWAPLKAAVEQVASDLLKWGYYAYQLVTHPDQLAVILLDALIAAAEAAFWRIAAPAGAFALKLVMANAARFAQLIETIIAGAL
jgi:hypothetical protein